MLLDGGVIGRLDDMVVVRGVNIYPVPSKPLCGAAVLTASIERSSPGMASWMISVSRWSLNRTVRRCQDWRPSSSGGWDFVLPFQRLPSAVCRGSRQSHDDLLISVPGVRGKPPMTTSVFPTKLEKPTEATLRIEWSDGCVTEYQAVQLRDVCPCATCREKRAAPPAPPSEAASDHNGRGAAGCNRRDAARRQLCLRDRVQ